MKIIYLADTENVHTRKWVNHFLKKGHEIICISLSNKKIEGTKHISIMGEKNLAHSSLFHKLSYLKRIKFIKDFIHKEKPDILHTHYASSYGLIGSLCNYHPFIISLWGSDIFEFPRKNLITKKIMEFNLSKADFICSTSKIMATEGNKYTPKNILITPFGVDTEIFKPMPEIKKLKNSTFVIGIVKSLETIYGIDILIKAFKVFSDKYNDTKLVIVGKGSKEVEYKQLVKDLNLNEKVEFVGRVLNEEVPKYLNSFDLYTALSLEESFGVAAIEAMSCNIPVLLSNVSGFAEIVSNNENGFLVESKNPPKTALLFEELYNDRSKLEEISKKSRSFVLNNYDWTNNAKIMEDIYNGIIKN